MNTVKQLDIFGNLEDVKENLRKKASRTKPLNKEKIEKFLDDLPTSVNVIKNDILSYKNKYLNGFVRGTILKVDDAHVDRYNVSYADYFQKNICTCGHSWYSYKRMRNYTYYTFDDIKPDYVCPACGAPILRISAYPSLEKITHWINNDNCSYNIPVDMGYLYYVHKLNAETIRIDKYSFNINIDSKNNKPIPLLKMNMFMIIDFKKKKIVTKKCLKHRLKDDSIFNFLTLSKKYYHTLAFPNGDTLLEFLDKNKSIQKYSGLKEYKMIYEKYIKSTIHQKDGYETLNDLMLFFSFILVMSKIPHIELLLKSYASIPVAELISQISTAWSVNGIKNKVKNIENILNPEAKNAKNAINIPAYIVKDLKDKGICSLSNIENFIRIYSGYNIDNNEFKGSVQNIEDDAYPAILDTYLEKYKNKEGIKKLIYQAKKKNLTLSEFKENVEKTQLESFGKNEYEKMHKKLVEFRNKGISFNLNNLSKVLSHGVTVEQEVNYLIKQSSREVPEYIKLEIDSLDKTDDTKKELLIGYIAHKARDLINMHIDYIDMAIMVTNDNNMVNVNIDMFPSNLQNAHDNLSVVVKSLEQKEFNDKCKENGEKLESKFKSYVKNLEYYKNSEYTLVFPKSSSDICAEAQMQHNCIASYTKKYAERKTIIAFFRRKDALEKSFISVEYNTETGAVIQAYYAHNRPISNELFQIVSAYGKFISTFDY